MSSIQSPCPMLLPPHFPHPCGCSPAASALWVCLAGARSGKAKPLFGRRRSQRVLLSPPDCSAKSKKPEDRRARRSFSLRPPALLLRQEFWPRILALCGLMPNSQHDALILRNAHADNSRFRSVGGVGKAASGCRESSVGVSGKQLGVSGKQRNSTQL